MKVYAIDPGDRVSGVVWYDTEDHSVGVFEDGKDNDKILFYLRHGKDVGRPEILVAIEDIVAMGQAVGKTVFETKEWIGRFREAAEFRGVEVMKVKRPDVKIAMCGRATQLNPKTGRMQGITDSAIRRAVLDRFPATGGGSEPAKGTKKQPGPLYGMTKHVFQALAVALTAVEMANIRG